MATDFIKTPSFTRVISKLLNKTIALFLKEHECEKVAAVWVAKNFILQSCAFYVSTNNKNITQIGGCNLTHYAELILDLPQPEMFNTHRFHLFLSCGGPATQIYSTIIQALFNKSNGQNSIYYTLGIIHEHLTQFVPSTDKGSYVMESKQERKKVGMYYTPLNIAKLLPKISTEW